MVARTIAEDAAVDTSVDEANLITMRNGDPRVKDGRKTKYCHRSQARFTRRRRDAARSTTSSRSGRPVGGHGRALIMKKMSEGANFPEARSAARVRGHPR